MNNEVAICLVYLMQGFDAEHSHMYADGPGDTGTVYEIHSDLHGGNIGIVSDFVPYAQWIETYVAQSHAAQDFPGVFHYEVTEELGRWLFENPGMYKLPEFIRYATRVINEWFAEGLAAQAHSGHGLGHVPDLPAPTDTGLTLNASQPADVTKEGSTTMKILDLIDSLVRIQDAYGNVDVVIRGSKETTFVDAQEVRYVKTPKRHTVYIGKAKAQQPQE